MSTKKENTRKLSEDTVIGLSEDTVIGQTVTGLSEETANELSESGEYVKAQRILRAKFPGLSERNFNFEKRTGHLFTASIVKVFDEDGQPVLENGVHKEKLTQKVVDVEGETGEILPEFKLIEGELKAKRSAAFILRFDAIEGKNEAKLESLSREIDRLQNTINENRTSLREAKEFVMSVDLPERSARANVAAKLTAATDKLEKMKSMLLAAGLSESEIMEQLNG